jgi:hypothetical protein
MPWEQQGEDIDGSGNWSQSGYAVALSRDGLTVAIGAPYYNSGRGYVRVYKLTGGAWTKQGSDIYGEQEWDNSGWSVSLSDNGLIVAIGAVSNGDNGGNSGNVRVYKLTNGDWEQQGSDIYGEADGDNAGRSVSLSSDGLTIAVGADSQSSNNKPGRVRVYKLTHGEWDKQGSDMVGKANMDHFGQSVSLSSDGLTVAIGAYHNGGDVPTSGYVCVYKLTNGEWGKQGGDINGESSVDFFGWSVSLSSDGLTVAIGAPGSTEQVRVYKLTNGDWGQQGSNIVGEASGEHIGYSVSLSGDGLTVAIRATDSAGHVRVYKLTNGEWVKQGSDINGEASADSFGRSVSLSSDGLTIAIGASTNTNDGGTSAGHVRVFTFSQPTPVAPVCFLADAPVLTPTGYHPISTLAVGDLVRTAAGRDVAVKRVFVKEYTPSTSANPFVIPKGTFGALRALPISPNHEVMTAKGMVKAKDLGLPRMKMTDSFTYYNLELEDWVRDNLVVAGVECESLAPAARITMTKAEFGRFVRARYGPAAAVRLRSVCFEQADGCVSMPKL